MNLCFVNGNHFNVLYEPDKNKNIDLNITDFNTKKNNKIDLTYIINKNLKLNKDINFKYTFANDKKVIKYEDIYNYLEYKNINGEGIFPNSIYNIPNKQSRKNKKNDFKDA